MRELKKIWQKRKFYSMMMILFPSILLVIASMGMENFLARSIAQLILFTMQVLFLKGLLDDYYSA